MPISIFSATLLLLFSLIVISIVVNYYYEIRYELFQIIQSVKKTLNRRKVKV